MIGERALRAILAVIAVYHVVTGLLALVAPDTFFDQIGHYGIENSHYVGDVGAFLLAFGVAVGIAVVPPRLARPAALAGGALVRVPCDQPCVRHGRSEERGARLERHAADRLRRGGVGLAGAGLGKAEPGREEVGMKVFVAGASGAIGRPLVRQLVEAGHEVTGTTRREERAKEIRAAGANAVVCDVFDAAALREAVTAAAPEVVVNQLTSLPQRYEPSKASFYEATDRVRGEGAATC